MSQLYMFQPKNSHAIAEIGLFYKWLIDWQLMNEPE